MCRNTFGLRLYVSISTARMAPLLLELRKVPKSPADCELDGKMVIQIGNSLSLWSASNSLISEFHGSQLLLDKSSKSVCGVSRTKYRRKRASVKPI